MKQKNLLKIYKTLEKNLGNQLWWPVTSKGNIKPKYSGGPKTDKQRLEICIGAILTQNTSWKNVEKAIENLNKNNLIDVLKIKNIDEKKLAELIKPSGYYNRKAKKLKFFSSFLIKNYDGSIKSFFNKNIQDLRNELLSINGIGPETADSIILYAAKKPIFVIDAYTKRIFNMLGYKQKTYDEFQKLFMDNLPKDAKLFNEYHALIVELGRNYCKKKPDCEKCFLVYCCKKIV